MPASNHKVGSPINVWQSLANKIVGQGTFVRQKWDEVGEIVRLKHDALCDYIDAYIATKQDLIDVSVGQIPDGTITAQKLDSNALQADKTKLLVSTANLYALSGVNGNADSALIKAITHAGANTSLNAFYTNANVGSLDIAFGKGRGDGEIYGIGLALAWYAWAKGDSRATYPFTALLTCNTLVECLTTGMSEIISNSNIASLIASSPYASPLLDSYMETFMATNGTAYCNNSTNFNKIINNPAILASALKSASFRLAMYNNASVTAPIIAGSTTMITAMQANTSQYVNSTGTGATGTAYAGKCFVFSATGWRTGGSGTGNTTWSTFTTGATSVACAPPDTNFTTINRFASALTWQNDTQSGYTSGYSSVKYFKI